MGVVIWRNGIGHLRSGEVRVLFSVQVLGLDANYKISRPLERRFLGVVSGNFSEDQDFTLEIDTTIRGKEHANSGIAVIVPADEVKSLIENDPTLKAGREAVIKQALHK